jgi:hypothetical protein
MAGQNRGDFITTTQSWDVTELKQMDVSSDKFKELFVRMYQQLNNMAQSINTKGSGRFNTQEFATGETFYPSPSISSATNANAAPRPVFRRVLNMLPSGTLPNTGTLTVAHGLTFNSANTLTRLYGAATNAAGTSMIPIPYSSPTAANNIELYADATNIYLITGSNRTSYTKCNVIIEFLKN